MYSEQVVFSGELSTSAYFSESGGLAFDSLMDLSASCLICIFVYVTASECLGI